MRERGGREGRGERIREEREGEWGRERIREGEGEDEVIWLKFIPLQLLMSVTVHS